MLHALHFLGGIRMSVKAAKTKRRAMRASLPILAISLLHPTIVGQFCDRNRLGENCRVNLRHAPFPMLGMAIGKPEIATLRVPVGRHIPPNSAITPLTH